MFLHGSAFWSQHLTKVGIHRRPEIRTVLSNSEFSLPFSCVVTKASFIASRGPLYNDNFRMSTCHQQLLSSLANIHPFFLIESVTLDNQRLWLSVTSRGKPLAITRFTHKCSVRREAWQEGAVPNMPLTAISLLVRVRVLFTASRNFPAVCKFRLVGGFPHRLPLSSLIVVFCESLNQLGTLCTIHALPTINRFK